MSGDLKQDGHGLHDRDKQQGDLQNDQRAHRELPEGLKRERKGPVGKDSGRNDEQPN